GLCACPAEFFGDHCEKERVQFHAHNGLCLLRESNTALCKGLVLAASLNDREYCNSAQDCTTWDTVKRMVGIMWEAELGDIIVDSIAVLFCLLAIPLRWPEDGQSKSKHVGKYLFLAGLVCFVADVALESVLVHFVGGAADVVAELEGAFCFSRGDASRSLVLLEDLAGTIATFAWVNIALAIVGGSCDVIQAFMDTNPGLIAVVLTVVAAVSELVLGLSNFFMNTNEFVSIIKEIELATLGLAEMEEGHACYMRHPQLDELLPAEAVGVEWIHPGLTVVMPAVLAFMSFLCAICIACLRAPS
ncbi:unnamed protein product, partial [Symbiodinium necroappetens]